MFFRCQQCEGLSLYRKGEMKRQYLHVGVKTCLAAITTAVLATGGLTAATRNTPHFPPGTKNLGPVDASTVVDVSIRLNLHNRAAFDSLVEEMYNRSSTNYHRWLTRTDFESRFAPTAADVNTVKAWFASHNLAVTNVGPMNFYVKARGTVGAIEKAFKVNIDKFEMNGSVYRANTSDPTIDGAAASLAFSVAGLDNLEFQIPRKQQGLPATPNSGSSLERANVTSASSADPTIGTNLCFTGKRTDVYNTDGSYPTVTLTGATYNGNENPVGCGYAPQDIYKAYNLTGLYAEGYDGTGQTIVIIDWCGEETITSDANAFSSQYGLPALTSKNFSIIYPGVTPSCASPNAEISLDVEWAHAIAPGANIDLVVPPSGSFSDVNEAEIYAIAYGLGNTISGSYGSEEYYTPTSVLTEEDTINAVAAAFGISANFASGDYGDYTFDAPQYNPPSVSAPADSPHATAVGGITLATNKDGSIRWETGWGTNETIVDDLGTLFVPPLNLGFDGGSGGGPSAVFSKPSFQSKLPGSTRLLPDISWIGDPFTGVIFAVSVPFQSPTLIWEIVGGTSVATPMFSGLWAIANQEAGVPLGQASQYLYSMPSGTITDIVPYTNPAAVTATVQTSSTSSTTYTAAELAAPLVNTTTFYSAIWNIPLYQDYSYIVTFGTDSGLTVTPGWDDVTGLGVPNPKAFANYFHP